jgi:endonuclease-3 related protein
MEQTNKLKELFERLLHRYGRQQNWWPAETPFEVCAGAVLTQNTSWSNVEKAIKNFGSGLSPEYVIGADIAEIAEIIRPSGFFNQKAVYLKAVAGWFAGYAPGGGVEADRAALLKIRGVGKETADAILCYAFGQPTFVVDAYTKRLFTRLNIGFAGYEPVREMVMAAFPNDTRVYKEFHALIVRHAKERCRKDPVCEGCPVEPLCFRLT